MTNERESDPRSTSAPCTKPNGWRCTGAPEHDGPCTPEIEGGVCDCGHAKAEHLRGVGCCTSPLPFGDEDCGCGVFRNGADATSEDGMCIQITTPGGHGLFRVSASPDASPELRDALLAIAREAFTRLEAVAAAKGADT